MSDTQARASKKLLADQEKVNQQKQTALLLDDKRLIAQADYDQTLIDIDKRFAGQVQTQEVLAQKLEMQRVAAIDYILKHLRISRNLLSLVKTLLVDWLPLYQKVKTSAQHFLMYSRVY